MNNASTLAIEINGEKFTGWKRSAFDFDIESLSSSFSLFARDKKGILNDLESGTAIKAYIENGRQRVLIMNGFITSRERELSENNVAVTITGSDKLIDVVECSTFRKSQTWIKKRFTEIVTDLITPFNVTLDKTDLTDDPIIDKLTIQSGETAFDTIERLCRSQAVLPISTFDGVLKLTYAGTDRADIDLILGENIKSVREATDWTERFSDYICLAQTPGSGKRWTKAMVQGRAEAFDRGVTRYRPKVFIAESKTKATTLKQRVNWEAQVRSGRATDYSVVLSGWFQKDAIGNLLSLWEKNKLVTLVVDEYNVDRDFLITSVSMTLDESGEITVLSLRHPDTYKPDPTEEVDLT